ncbi:PAS domain-containing protein [Selenomonas sp. TAMA-11512]|uniref:PAS domain-containing protein n=1 Tax=Selenomonas sp. TAMA-11512 TaxID=3095337 RepID=UPI00308731A0|nr:PAS domain-containing protein [Selenomonas sp. TAMA-11512]
MHEKTLNIDKEKAQAIADLLKAYIEGTLPYAELQKTIDEKFDRITPAEFAYGEQLLPSMGIPEAQLEKHLEEIIHHFAKHIDPEDVELPEGHPIHTFLKENSVIEETIAEMKELLEKTKFIKNPWLIVYDKLKEYPKHLVRKENQLFPALEKHGITGPSRIMWTFDDLVKKGIGQASKMLEEDKIEEFIAFQKTVISRLEDILFKEQRVLFQTALKVLNEKEFRQMRIGEEEVGFANIEPPTGFLPKDEGARTAVPSDASLLGDLTALLQKHGIQGVSSAETSELTVKNGKLTLEQINLIYQHMPVDLTFTDENDIVKFYTDTKHRVFARSAGVIGRIVQNCHPKEVLPIVEHVITSLRSGEQDEAEFAFWKGGKQAVYVTYLAVRDADGKFRGVLEMMQDVTHILDLFSKGKGVAPMSAPAGIHRPESGAESGSPQASMPVEDAVADIAAPAENPQEEAAKEDAGFSLHTTLHTMLKRHPWLKDWLMAQSPNYKHLNNPVMVKTMGRIADIKTIAERGGFDPQEFLNKINAEVKNRT